MARFRTQINRLTVIDERIRAGKYPNSKDLAEDRQIETSTKTVQRDIRFLVDEFQAPIKYDPFKRGYYYTDPNYRFPMIVLSEGELFAVCIAEKVLKHYEGTPLYGRLAPIFDKLKKTLPEKISISPDLIVDSRFSFFGDFKKAIDPEVWNTVTTGLREQKTVAVHYQLPGWDEAMAREIDSYHVVGYQGEWYVVAWCHYKQDIRTFAFSRIKSAELLSQRFEVPQDFSFEKFAGNHFGIIWGDQEYDVRIEFTPDQAPYIKEREWHPTQAITENEDGSIVLSLKTNDLYELTRWILAWGPGARVLAPKELRDQVRTELENALKGYEQNPCD